MRMRHLLLSSIVAVLAVPALISCGGGGGGGGLDTAAPTVSSTNPAGGATGVATSVAVTATFNEAMDSSTITAATFLVSNATGTISGSVSYNSTTHTATFTPASALVSSTTYTATITTGATDAAGNPLASDKVWSFQTTAPTSGSLDPSFGALGIVKTDMGTYDQANGMAIQADGKIVVVGWNSNGMFSVARYSADGSLDPDFGTGGKVTMAVGSAASWANAVAIQQDGKIVVAGLAFESSVLSIALVRYNTDGSLDNTFGVGGIATLAVDGYATAIAIDNTTGNIIVAGDTELYNTALNSWDFIVARFTSSGVPDTTFSTDGWTHTDFKPTTYASGSSLADQAYGVALQTDGKIVVAGSAENDAWLNDFAIARFNTDGTLSGKVTYDFGSFTDNVAHAVAISGTNIVVAGVGDYNYFGILRLTSSLALDTTFNSTGQVLTDIGGDSAAGYALAVQPDGKIVVAGRVKDSSSPYPQDFALVRYTTTGSLDTGFGTGGKVRTDTGSPTDTLSAVAIQPDGKIVAAGTVEYDFVVVRYIQ